MVVHADVVTVPAPVGLVNDYASVFTEEFSDTLEEKLDLYKGKTRTQIAVLTVDSLDGESADDFAEEVYREWALGEKFKENGVLVLLAQDEQLVHIEYGAGLAGYLTRERARAVAQGIVEPALKRNEYEEGVFSAVAAIQGYIGGLPATPVFADVSVVPLDVITLVAGFILVRILLGGLMGIMESSENIWLGGLFGAAAGLYINLAVGEPTYRSIALFTGFFTLLGLLIDLAVSRHLIHRASRGLGFHPIFGGKRRHRKL